MNAKLKTVLAAIRAAQGALRDGQHHSHTERAMLRDILCDAKLTRTVRVLSAAPNARRQFRLLFAGSTTQAPVRPL